MASVDDRPAVSAAVTRAFETRPYERKPDDPIARPLRIFTLDPAASVGDGAVATVDVPYEPIDPASDERGFRGRVFEVGSLDRGRRRAPLDLNDEMVLLQSGRAPSPSDPLFHQQMVYAVASIVYASFRTALGRTPSWGFKEGFDAADGRRRLRLEPYATETGNAWYDKSTGTITFGYVRAPADVQGRTPPHGYVFTSLSHDVVTHEVTHALLDSLRARFMVPTNPDVLAFHEAFADLMAILHHFSHRDVVEAALERTRGRVDDAALLADLAVQFGQALGVGGRLRTPLEPPDGTPRQYDPALEPHALGTVLVSAVFEAFATVFQRKTARYVRLATNGTGVLPPGAMPIELRRLLAAEATEIARQFIEICIRAIDYCPPVDVTFGEFLRAVITADYQLVHDDRWQYREAWIDAFRVRRILPRDVPFLSFDSLLWHGPDPRPPLPIAALTFARLQFDGDPAQPAGKRELKRQAQAIADMVYDPDYAGGFGIARNGEPALHGDTVDRPCVHSVRVARRVGPDGQVLFDLVAEVTQKRHTRRAGVPFDFLGGATVIIGPDGRVRYFIGKSVLDEQRLEREASYAASPGGAALWEVRDGRRVRRAELLRRLHE